MVKISALTVALMTGIAFSLGLVLGLVLHIPGSSLPDPVIRSRRAAGPLPYGSPVMVEDTPVADKPQNNVENDLNNIRKHIPRTGAQQNIGISGIAKSPIIVKSNKGGNENIETKAVQSDNLNSKYAEPHIVESGNVYDRTKQIHIAGGSRKDSVKDGESVQYKRREHIYSDFSGKFVTQKQGSHVRVNMESTNQVTIQIRGQSGEWKGLAGQPPDQIWHHNERPGVPSLQSQTKDALPKMAEFSSDFTQLSDLVDGIYWNRKVELLVPAGFSDEDVVQWRKLVNTTKVVGMQEGCGRMQNRRLTFLDATPACARYRINTDQTQGEIFSYYLSRLLGIYNVPPSCLALADMTSPQWSDINRDIVLAQWSSEKPVILTPWVHNLKPAYIPEELRTDSRKLHPTKDVLFTKTVDQLKELAQWSDLIVFDYLTANLDRVVNNMFNKQWNSQMMESPTHNLEKSSKDDSLIFIDNESGLFHSYRLLDKYSHYHESLLKSLCIFRENTADMISRLHHAQNAGSELMKLYQKHEPLHHWLPRLPEKNAKTLQERIANVFNQMKACESLYGAR